MSKPQNPLWQTTKTERKSYYSYFFGQNMIYHMIAGYLTTFLLLIGVDPVKSAIVMLVVKVWDAVNDAIFGVIFDKIKFKSNQKYIPWLKIACALTPASTIAIFVIPTASSEMVKLIWFALAYIVWDTAYTICDVPAFGIITSMTSNVEERNTILSLKGITAGVGMALTTVLVTVLISEFVGLGYGPVSIIVAVIAMATMFPVCKHCKERNKSIDEEQFTVRKMLKYVISNKYLLIYYIGYIFYSGAQTYNALHMITAYYIYNNSIASLITGTVAALPQLVMALLVPKIIRKMDKAKLFRISAIATILLSFLIIPTRGSFILFVIAFMLRSIPLGIIGVLSFTFTPDCAEYGQYTTGTEAKGITFAIQTFAVKLAAAISGSMGLALLGWFGFKTEFVIDGVKQEVSSFADLEKINAIAQQTTEALDGLWFTYNVVPIIGLVIAFVLWNFYKLNDKDVQVMADCNVGKITKEEAEKLLSKKY
ncbi:MAG: MFS transporter [Clostridia bacterium]|nr:MFS transporter [Clostridia bacterium]